MRLETLLQCLKDEQSKLAQQTLEQPLPGDFNYGKAVGMYAGLELAQRVLIDLVAEKDRRDFNL
ncbi:MAG: hypothetical protein RLZZ387_2622 [Chloroflexota bacterium]